MNYYLMALKRYAVFNGRATTAEYWYFILFNFIIGLVIGIIAVMLGDHRRLLTTIWGLAMLLPGLGVAIRRLHDTNRSGWWMAIGLIPLIGIIILIVLLVQDSQPDDNKYGPNPKAATANQKPIAPISPQL